MRDSSYRSAVRRPEKGFTLIEILVVIAIIGLLSGVIMASLAAARDKARIAAAKQQDSSIYNSLGANLAAAWDLDEGSGTSISDSSGNGNNGSFSPGTWTTETPYGIGSALAFNSVSNASFPNVKGMPASLLTVTAWVYLPAEQAGNASIVRLNWSSAGSWIIYVDANEKVRFGVSGVTLTGSDTLSIGEWHFIAATYDGTSMRLYVDGVQSGAPRALAQASLLTSGTVSMGNTANAYIDRVRVYDNTLQLAEIRKMYAAGPDPEISS